MKMSNNPAKYEVLLKQFLRSILDTSDLPQGFQEEPGILQSALLCNLISLLRICVLCTNSRQRNQIIFHKKQLHNTSEPASHTCIALEQ